jgi:glycosyltransferase involved in cell wall biosynthesis
MAKVSILIPAYKPHYLRNALLTARQQTFTDIEILVGDDTPDAALEHIVRGVSDSRIQYFHHGFQKGTRNSRRLWERASGKYVKWLFDDDLLMPTSVETLVGALVANPASLLAFHGRVVIDSSDTVTSVPPALLKSGETAQVDRSFLVQNMIGRINNFIGEPSNIMLDHERVDVSGIFDYRSFALHFLGDVAIYLNLSEQAPLVAVGGYLSAFRQHAGQSSNPNAPSFSAGLYEWELMVRGEAAAGHLAASSLPAVQQTLSNLYSSHGAALPEIERLRAHLNELTERPPQELFVSERFQADLAHARAAVEMRVAARNNALRAQLRRSEDVGN